METRTSDLSELINIGDHLDQVRSQITTAKNHTNRPVDYRKVLRRNSPKSCQFFAASIHQGLGLLMAFHSSIHLSLLFHTLALFLYYFHYSLKLPIFSGGPQELLKFRCIFSRVTIEFGHLIHATSKSISLSLLSFSLQLICDSDIAVTLACQFFQKYKRIRNCFFFFFYKPTMNLQPKRCIGFSRR